MTRRTRQCAVCERTFHDRQRTSIRQKYCSPLCAGQAKRDRAAKNYPSKLEVMQLYASGMSDRDLGHHYGRTHQWASGVRIFHGIAARSSGSWQRKPLSSRSDRARWGIHRKPETRCRNCGRTDTRIDLHHAIPRSMCRASKFDLRNGLPLCDRCHFGWHHKKLVIPRRVFKPEEWAFISSVRLVDRDITAWLDKHYPRSADAN